MGNSRFADTVPRLSALMFDGGPIAVEESTEQLRAVLNDEQASGAERAAAALRLGERRFTPAVEDMVGLLGRCSERVRGPVIHALGKMGDSRAAAALTEELTAPGHYRDVLCVVKVTPDQDMSRVDCGWVEETVHCGGLAAAALGRIGDPAAVPALVARLQDRDCPFRHVVADALGKIGSGQAVPALKQALDEAKESGDAVLASWARGAIARIESRNRSFRELVADLIDPDPAVVFSAVEAFAASSDEKAIPLLAMLLDDKRLVRRDAGTPTVIQPIGHAAKEAIAKLRTGPQMR